MLANYIADAGLCLLYIILNSALNFVNRYALGVHDFSFPLTLTAAHMLLNPVFLMPLMLFHPGYRSQHIPVVRGHWFGLLIIAALNSIQIAFNNSSLVYIEVSMNQVVRATMPVWVAAVQFLRCLEPPSGVQLFILAVISVGVICVVHQPSAATTQLFGVSLVSSSLLLQACQMSFAGSLLSAKLDSFQMTFYTSPVAFLTLCGPAIVMEGTAFRAYAAAKPGVTAFILIGTCSMAVFYNVVLFQTIRRLGAVGSSVLGNVKVVVLIMLSSVVLGEMRSWEVRHYVGCFFTLGGAAVYQHLRKGPAKKTN